MNLNTNTYIPVSTAKSEERSDKGKKMNEGVNDQNQNQKQVEDIKVEAEREIQEGNRKMTGVSAYTRKTSLEDDLSVELDEIDR